MKVLYLNSNEMFNTGSGMTYSLHFLQETYADKGHRNKFKTVNLDHFQYPKSLPLHIKLNIAVGSLLVF